MINYSIIYPQNPILIIKAPYIIHLSRQVSRYSRHAGEILTLGLRAG